HPRPTKNIPASEPLPGAWNLDVGAWSFHKKMITRREALTLLATLTTGTIFGANRLLAAAANVLDSARPLFTADEHALLNDIADTIIPTTPDSGGAKAADVASFMHEIVRDFYDDAERATFLAGLSDLQ